MAVRQNATQSNLFVLKDTALSDTTLDEKMLCLHFRGKFI